MNDRYDIIEYMFKESNKNIEKNEINLYKICQIWKSLEKQIEDKKFKKMPKNYKLLLGKYFNDENNKEILLKIFKEENYESFKKDNNEEEKKKKDEEKIIIDIEENKDKEKKENINKLKEILVFYKNYKFTSKKDDIIKIEKIIENGDLGKNDEQYLIDYDNAKIMNNRFKIIEYIFAESNKGNEKTEYNFNNCVNNWKSFEKQIKDKKFKKMPRNNKLILCNYFNDENNKEILLKIFTQREYEFFKEENRVQSKSKNHENKNKNKIKKNIDIEKDDINNENKENFKINENKQYKEEKNTDLKEVLNYYKKFLFESKKDDINLIEKAFENDDISQIKYENYLKDCDIARKMNEREDIIYFLLKYNDKWKNKKVTEEIIIQEIEIWENLEKFIKDKRLKKMRREHKEILYNFFKDDNNKYCLQKIFDQDIITYFINEVSKIKNLIKILIFYKNFKFESKKEEISTIQQFIECQETVINIEEYFKDLEKAEKLNDRFDIINYLFNSKNKNKIKNEGEFEQYIDMWKFFEDKINERKLNNIYLRDKHLIYDFFNNPNNNKFKSKIFKNESYQFFADDFNNNKNKRILLF